MEDQAKMNPSAPRHPMASLYVGDLHQDVTEAMLYEKFIPAGPILSLRVCREMITHHSLGFAYVHFKQPADAKHVLDTMDFHVMNGRPILITWAHLDPPQIFIKNLDKSVDMKVLYETFCTFGKIISCKVVCNEKDSKVYGLVHFETLEETVDTIEKMSGYQLCGKKLFVEQYRPIGENSAQLADRNKEFTIICIKNCGEDMDEAKLTDMFRKYGPIRSARVMTDDSGQAKGFSFVNYETHEDARKAVDEMNGKELNGNHLYVTPAQLKSEHRADMKHKFKWMKTDRMNGCQSTVHAQGQESLTASMLAAVSPIKQKQMLGERLFPLIQSMHPSLAGKITGMLLEIDNSELLHMLQSPESLRSKVDEAVAVLSAHKAKML